MPLPLIPLAGLALGGIAKLIQRRRQGFRGSAFGQAVNTGNQTPTNSVSTAATQDPNTAQTPAGQANTATTQPVGQTVAIGQAQPAAQPATGPQQARPAAQPSAARLGEEAIRKSRKKNMDQQQAITSQFAQQLSSFTGGT